MINILIQKNILPAKNFSASSVASSFSSMKSERVLNTIEFGGNSGSMSKNSSTTTITNSHENFELQIQHKLNNLLLIKEKLSECTLKLNKLNSINDLKNPAKLSNFKPSKMKIKISVVNKKVKRMNHLWEIFSVHSRNLILCTLPYISEY